MSYIFFQEIIFFINFNFIFMTNYIHSVYCTVAMAKIKHLLQKVHFIWLFFFLFYVCFVFNSKVSSALTLATSGDYEPYEFYKDGKLVGIDIDLAKELGKIMGIKIEIVDTGNFDTIFDDLDAGKYDGVMAGCDKTSERDAKFSVTDSYINGVVMYLQKGSDYIDPLNLAISELKNNGVIDKIANKYK